MSSSGTHTPHEYREDCPGCQLALMDEQGRRLPDTHPVVKMATKVWWEASLEERQACNRVWVHQSRTPEDMQLMKAVARRIEMAAKN
ncbi:MAG: hypothetical protein LUO79_07765 [Methanomassiliicoccales archaeon]|nr:hypothetical protein [Methanomassiliicoccales archaeon]